MPADLLIEIAKHAAATQDFETLTDCWQILRARSRVRPVRRLEQAAAEFDAAPIEWLDTARNVCRRFHRNTKGHHHLYAVLLDGFVNKGRFRKLPRQVDSSKVEFPPRADARGNALAAGFPARRAV
jgi:hypothetical protein